MEGARRPALIHSSQQMHKQCRWSAKNEPLCLTCACSKLHWNAHTQVDFLAKAQE